MIDFNYFVKTKKIYFCEAWDKNKRMIDYLYLYIFTTKFIIIIYFNQLFANGGVPAGLAGALTPGGNL